MRKAIGVSWLCATLAAASILLAEEDHKIKKELFQTSDRCFACHNGLSTSAGEDISIGFSWRPTMMANSARDPYWQAGVRRESIDHAESRAVIEDECSKCHMPMARYQSKFDGHEGEVFSHLSFGSDDRLDRMAQDGVSCSLCHQITKDKLGTRESLVGGFVVDTVRNLGEREEYGDLRQARASGATHRLALGQARHRQLRPGRSGHRARG